MTLEDLRAYCLAKPGTSEDLPFDEEVLTFKVLGKIFVLTHAPSFESLNLKCEPTLAESLRAEYEGLVLPGYHMNKRHWNTVLINAEIPEAQIYQWIDHSYEQVIAKLPKREQKRLAQQQDNHNKAFE